MANRKSWRRTVAPSSNNPRTATAKTFPAISDPALTTLFTALLAKQVTVSTVPGPSYFGLFAGTETVAKGELNIALRYARTSADMDVGPAVCSDVRGGVAAKVLIPAAVVVAVEGAAGVFDAVGSAEGFVTDGEISKGNSGMGRQLQRFNDFTELATSGEEAKSTLDEQTFGDLATANGSKGRKWDQFQVNEDKFGVKTSFDEHQYTTKIDRDDTKFAERQREAARLASEIEAKGSDNFHVREERNQDVATDMDEESRFSGVQRPAAQEQKPKGAALEPTQEKDKALAPEVTRPKLSYAAAAAGAVKSASQANAPAAALTTKPASAKAQTGKGQQTKFAPAKPHGPKVAASKTSQAKSASGKAVGGKAPPSKTAPNKPAGSKSSQPRAVTSKAGGSKLVPAKAVSAVTSVSHSGSSSSGGKQAPSKAHFSKQASPATPGTSPATENRESEAAEKRSKVSAGRQRSSRENLPQLVKVRSQITGRTSPNQSRNSPLPTPAAADTSAVAVLNLDAQTPNLGPEQIKSFEKYKTNREIQSIAENRERITDDLKKFSTRLDSRNGTLRRVNSNTSTSTSGTSAAPPSEKKAADPVPNAEEPEVTTNSPELKKEETKSSETVGSSGPEAATVAKQRPKSKLNPFAQEFKLNPDAPSFEPSARKQPASPSPAPQNYSPYVVRSMQPDYSQSMPAGHQGYPVPMQAMGQIPYGQPYGLVVQGHVPAGMGGGNPGYQFMQGPPGSFPAPQVPHVPGRFPQSAPMAGSYAYPQMNPTMPMVMAQAPQRMPPGPYGYYNSGPYPGTQVPGPQMGQPPQHQLYAPGGPQGGVPQMHGGGMSTGGRGGHGYMRRGNGGGRRGGKQHGQHVHPPPPNVGGSQVDKGPLRSTESSVGSSMGQR